MSDTESASEITNKSYSGKSFEYVANRRYNNEEDVDYVLPNDDGEIDRLESQHKLFKYALQCNYHAPLKKQLEEGISVIDAGCGPAAWTLDMAETYPNSKFTGIDVSFVFPEGDKPDNVEFGIHNIGQDLDLPENSYDYYFQRFLIAGLTNDSWNASLKNAYKLLKPGGYVEMMEPNVSEYYNGGPVTTQIQTALGAIFTKKGIVNSICHELGDRMKQTGFINVKSLEVALPHGHTDKVGELLLDDFMRVLSTMRPVLNMINPAYADDEEYEKLTKVLTEEAATYQTYMINHIHYAQKPLEEDLE